jgi:hypothetical protein
VKVVNLLSSLRSSPLFFEGFEDILKIPQH